MFNPESRPQEFRNFARRRPYYVSRTRSVAPQSLSKSTSWKERCKLKIVVRPVAITFVIKRPLRRYRTQRRKNRSKTTALSAWSSSRHSFWYRSGSKTETHDSVGAHGRRAQVNILPPQRRRHDAIPFVTGRLSA